MGLYIFWILHQTTTKTAPSWLPPQLYIFWILHQTTTDASLCNVDYSCISFESYIKPQLTLSFIISNTVVYLLNPTSNHNNRPSGKTESWVVYLLNPTSNHNTALAIPERVEVVYLLNPTSNHNNKQDKNAQAQLYIFWILHQTTTCEERFTVFVCCISFESYIKPQHIINIAKTSISCISFESYIKPQPLKW